MKNLLIFVFLALVASGVGGQASVDSGAGTSSGARNASSVINGTVAPTSEGPNNGSTPAALLNLTITQKPSESNGTVAPTSRPILYREPLRIQEIPASSESPQNSTSTQKPSEDRTQAPPLITGTAESKGKMVKVSAFSASGDHSSEVKAFRSDSGAEFRVEESIDQVMNSESDAPVDVKAPESRRDFFISLNGSGLQNAGITALLLVISGMFL